MQVIQGSVMRLETEAYQLELAVPPSPSFLLAKNSGRQFGFVAGGDCTLAGAFENNSNSTSWSAEKQADGSVICRRTETSTLWSSKQFCVHAGEHYIEWYHQLTGEGALEDIRWFRCVYDDCEYGFSGDFDEILTSVPNFREKQWYHPTDVVRISNGDDLGDCNLGQALASVPHVLGLHDREDTALVGVGAFAEPGEYLWDELVWNPAVRRPPTDFVGDQRKAGGFAIVYAGKKQVKGTWTSPRLVMTFSADAAHCLTDSLEQAYRFGYLPRPAAQHQNAPWWNSPIYCTWHDQTSMGEKDIPDFHKMPLRTVGEYCTQKQVEHWLQCLLTHDVKPGIVILDDKWQKTKLNGDPDTAKWPDMRGWIESCHQRGIRVFLWGLAWHKEDIPLEEAITRDGNILCGDVTNPLYQERLKRKIRTYFSDEPGCLNADGVKIDGLLGLPTGAGLKSCQPIWGLELQRLFLKLVHDEAKKYGKEICISTFAANPYLDEFTDMVRLADMYAYRLSTIHSMRWRKQVYDATHPGILVDTDGQMNFTRDPKYAEVLLTQPQLGIPTIYNAELVRFYHFFFQPEFRTWTEEDYKLLKKMFGQR